MTFRQLWGDRINRQVLKEEPSQSVKNALSKEFDSFLNEIFNTFFGFVKLNILIIFEIDQFI